MTLSCSLCIICIQYCNQRIFGVLVIHFDFNGSRSFKITCKFMHFNFNLVILLNRNHFRNIKYFFSIWDVTFIAVDHLIISKHDRINNHKKNTTKNEQALKCWAVVARKEEAQCKYWARCLLYLWWQSALFLVEQPNAEQPKYIHTPIFIHWVKWFTTK